uniref:RanBP2-type domain-containing protein n=1 Tax=Panagrolaimus sp. JU765 TaxID=591449 RepID=A0AC34Q361_9BILA
MNQTFDNSTANSIACLVQAVSKLEVSVHTLNNRVMFLETKVRDLRSDLSELEENNADLETLKDNINKLVQPRQHQIVQQGQQPHPYPPIMSMYPPGYPQGQQPYPPTSSMYPPGHPQGQQPQPYPPIICPQGQQSHPYPPTMPMCPPRYPQSSFPSSGPMLPQHTPLALPTMIQMMSNQSNLSATGMPYPPGFFRPPFQVPRQPSGFQSVVNPQPASSEDAQFSPNDKLVKSKPITLQNFASFVQSDVVTSQSSKPSPANMNPIQNANVGQPMPTTVLPVSQFVDVEMSSVPKPTVFSPADSSSESDKWECRGCSLEINASMTECPLCNIPKLPKQVSFNQSKSQVVDLTIDENVSSSKPPLLQRQCDPPIDKPNVVIFEAGKFMSVNPLLAEPETLSDDLGKLNINSCEEIKGHEVGNNKILQNPLTDKQHAMCIDLISNKLFNPMVKDNDFSEKLLNLIYALADTNKKIDAHFEKKEVQH